MMMMSGPLQCNCRHENALSGPFTVYLQHENSDDEYCILFFYVNNKINEMSM